MRRMLLMAALSGGALAAWADAAAAAVYCRTAGVPRGCVMRPAPTVVVAPRPATPAVVVAPGTAAPGVVVRPGAGVNLGGPINRPGLR